MDLQQFITDLMHYLSIPNNTQNRKFLTDWANAEKRAKGKPHGFNPLNTTKNLTIDKGQTNFNNNAGYPVKNYSTLAYGVKATGDTLKLGYYKGILNMLKGIDVPNKNAQIAKELRTWGTVNFANKISPKTPSEKTSTKSGYLLPVILILLTFTFLYFTYGE